MSPTPCPSREVRVTLVEAPGCHFCADAHEALAAVAEDGHRIEVSTVNALSTEGRALMQRHRAALSPLVLVEGAFFSQGRLPRRKLVRLLEQRQAAVAPRPTAKA